VTLKQGLWGTQLITVFCAMFVDMSRIIAVYNVSQNINSSQNATFNSPVVFGFVWSWWYFFSMQ